ncbi:MAG: hypothetical protein HOV81_00765 [Kofleriaceae bacterium]|nr:hypothetical protein [Kofleriaceae bacterium]
MKPAIVVMLLCTCGIARAEGRATEGTLHNFLIGPVLGVRLGGPPGSRMILGVEGGAGIGPERINVGFEHRLDKGFLYVELDPWWVIGGSLGVGTDTDGEVFPVLGVWEGGPISTGKGECFDWNTTITLAAGYRYTGVHELYVTVKAGTMDGMYTQSCLDD